MYQGNWGHIKNWFEGLFRSNNESPEEKLSDIMEQSDEADDLMNQIKDSHRYLIVSENFDRIGCFCWISKDNGIISVSAMENDKPIPKEYTLEVYKSINNNDVDTIINVFEKLEYIYKLFSHNNYRLYPR
jgi:hypothetical protein